MAHSDPETAGVGGWLAFLVLVLAVFRPLGLLYATYHSLYGIPEMARLFAGVWSALQWLEWLLAAADIACCGYLAWRLNYRRVPRTVPLAIAGIWLVTFGYQLLEILGTAAIGAGDLGTMLSYVGPRLIPGIVFSLLWTAYLLRSKRVANTYRRHDTAMGEAFT